MVIFFLYTEATTVMCDRCLNNSTCRVITNIQSNVSTFHCACLQGWIGERCQIRVRLLLVSVTMTSATLQREFLQVDADAGSVSTNNFDLVQVAKVKNAENNLDGGLVPSSNDLTSGVSGISFRYTQAQLNVNYWSGSHSKECNIVPNLTRSVFTISGLDSRTKYTFCAKTDHTYMCDFNLVSQLNDPVPACVFVTTKADETSVPSVYLILISCVAIAGLIILLIVVIVSKRNNYFTSLICLRQKKDHHKSRGAVLQGSPLPQADDNHPDIYLLKTPTVSQTISITAPNCPGKPKYQLIKKRLRGYASFSAQNEQTIPLSTVLEYSEGDLDGDYICSDTDSNIAEETEIFMETNIYVPQSDGISAGNAI